MRRNALAAMIGAATLGLGLASTPAPADDEFERKTREPPKKPKRANPAPERFSAPIPASGSIAQGRRHGGAHQHSREIERARRQADRKAQPKSGG
jgi:hypothetical protein